MQTFRLVERRSISRSTPLMAQSQASPWQLVRDQQAAAPTQASWSGVTQDTLRNEFTFNTFNKASSQQYTA